MSTSDQQATRQSPFQGPGAAQRQQRRAESDHRRRPDEEKDQQAEKQEEGSSRPDLWRKFASALPLIFGLGFCVVFFIWVCLQMAGQTVGGPPLLLGIFGGAILGIAAAGAGVGIARLTSSNGSSED